MKEKEINALRDTKWLSVQTRCIAEIAIVKEAHPQMRIQALN